MLRAYNPVEAHSPFPHSPSDSTRASGKPLRRLDVNHETQEIHKTILYREECYAIQGAVFDVYREMGCGFLEAVYQECVEKELRLRGVPFESQKELRLTYKGQP